MKITRFEEFLERSIPYFIIGLLLVILWFFAGIVVTDQRIKKRCQKQVEFTKPSLLKDVNISVGHKGNCKNHKPCE